MFAMFIDQNSQSKIQMGGYNLKKYASGPMKFYNIISPYYWMLPLGEMRIGDKPFVPSVNLIMADTGASLNIIPEDDFQRIVKMVLGDKECFVSATSLTVCKCTKEEHEQVPDIHFKIDGDEFTIPRDMWYERGGANGHSCVVKFMHGKHKENWVMGLNFYTRYYAVFDYENQRVGFADSIIKDSPPSKFFINWATKGL